MSFRAELNFSELADHSIVIYHNGKPVGYIQDEYSYGLFLVIKNELDKAYAAGVQDGLLQCVGQYSKTTAKIYNTIYSVEKPEYE